MKSDSSDDGGGELSLVKAEWNCLSKISAFDLLSLQSVPLNFSGAVPMLSRRFDLMYLQNSLELFWASPHCSGQAHVFSFTFLLYIPFDHRH